MHRARIVRAPVEHHLHHLRDHISGTANDHGVANHQTQTRHFVHVVQRGIGHGHARHLDRLKARNRSDRTRTPDLELNIQQFGQLFHCREFMGDCPARFTCTKAQFALRGQAIDLEHHAVDFIRQRGTTLTNVTVVVQALGNAFGQFQLVTDGHAPLLQLLEIANVRVGKLFRNLPQAVAAKLQRTAGGDFRIQLAQAASRCVTRIGKGLATRRKLGFIEAVKTRLGHKDFTAHFQHRRPAAALQLERDVAHGAHVDADVFTGGAITAGRAAHQNSVLIQQADRQTVELGFAAVFNFCTAAEQIASR